MIPKIISGVCPIDKIIAIKEIKSIKSLGNKIVLVILQTETILKPIKSIYPKPKANATGIFKRS